MKDRVGDADLPYVVDDAAAVKRVQRVLGQAESLAEEASRLTDALCVPFRERVLRLDRRRQREDHVLGAVQGVVELLEA